MTTFHNIDGVLVPFDSKWDIAISLSGGADSALLSHILCSLATKKQTIHIINHTRMWKTRPWQEWDARNVYEYLLKKFPELCFVFHKNFIAPEIEYGNIGPSLTDEYGKKVSGDNIQQRAFGEYICNKHNIDAYYNAVTRNPRSASFNGMTERDVEPTEENQHLYFMKHMDRYAVHPFRFVEKDWIVRQYKRLGIEDLFELTRSCEGEFENITYKSYTPGQYVPICGECFWCKEREWAINENSKS